MPPITSKLRALATHLSRHAAYANYPIYALLLFAVYSTLFHWPMSSESVRLYFQSLAFRTFSDQAWLAASLLTAALAAVGSFNSVRWKRILALFVLATQIHQWSQDFYYAEGFTYFLFTPFYEIGAVLSVVLAVVLVGPIPVIAAIADNNPAAVSFAFALYWGFLYAVARRFWGQRIQALFQRMIHAGRSRLAPR